MNAPLVIFDLDGTIADTMDGIMLSANLALKKHGYTEHDRTFYIEAMGHGSRELIRVAMCQDHDDEKVDRVLQDYIGYYKLNWSVGLHSYHGIEKVISTLIGKGYKLAVNTNKPHHLALRVVQHLFDQEAFIDIKGAHVDYNRKPDPEGVQLILSGLEEKTDNIVYIGDSIVDYETSINACIPFIGVEWGYGDFSKTEAQVIAGNAAQLLSAIEDTFK